MFQYVEEADDDVNKVSQRPGAQPARGAHSKSNIYLTGNYRLQGGNLQANWYEDEKALHYIRGALIINLF
jgi:hypothetical protein